jgi:glutamyl-tRNA synthetase
VRPDSPFASPDDQEKGYEPEALLNFLALLGWDPTTALREIHGEELPFHQRDDDQSLYEIFTMPQLIRAFDLTHLSRRKAQVDMAKLNFINKMTLRVWGGRMSANDSAMVKVGKLARPSSWQERSVAKRPQLLSRYQADLENIEALKGS